MLTLASKLVVLGDSSILGHHDQAGIDVYIEEDPSELGLEPCSRQFRASSPPHHKAIVVGHGFATTASIRQSKNLSPKDVRA